MPEGEASRAPPSPGISFQEWMAHDDSFHLAFSMFGRGTAHIRSLIPSWSQGTVPQRLDHILDVSTQLGTLGLFPLGLLETLVLKRCAHGFMRVFLFLSGKYPGIEMLGPTVTSHLTSEGLPGSFPPRLHCFAPSLAGCEGSGVSESWPRPAVSVCGFQPSQCV